MVLFDFFKSVLDQVISNQKFRVILLGFIGSACGSVLFGPWGVALLLGFIICKDVVYYKNFNFNFIEVAGIIFIGVIFCFILMRSDFCDHNCSVQYFNRNKDVRYNITYTVYLYFIFVIFLYLFFCRILYPADYYIDRVKEMIRTYFKENSIGSGTDKEVNVIYNNLLEKKIDAQIYKKLILHAKKCFFIGFMVAAFFSMGIPLYFDTISGVDIPRNNWPKRVYFMTETYKEAVIFSIIIIGSTVWQVYFFLIDPIVIYFFMLAHKYRRKKYR